MTAGDMAAHIAELVAEHGVLVVEPDDEGVEGAFAQRRLKRIGIPPVTDMSTYFAALHELGHCVGRGRWKPQLEREANAWVWALKTALCPATSGVMEEIRDCLQGYYFYGNIRMAFPPPGHAFWELADLDGEVLGRVPVPPRRPRRALLQGEWR